MEFLVLLLLVVGIAVAIAMAWWIARPMESLAKLRRAPFQFTVSDLLILFAMLQLTVGTIHYLVIRQPARDPAETRDGAFVADAFAATIAVFWWWCGASMVSRAGIKQWWHRAIVLVLVVAFGFASSVMTVVFVVIGLSRVVPACDTVLRIAGIACAILAIAGVCGVANRRIAAKYPPCVPANQSDSEDAPPPDSASTQE